MTRRIVLILLILLVAFVTYRVVSEHPSSPAPKPVEISREATSSSQETILPKEEITRVTYVFDGDTIEVTGGRRVRYIGMNAPEIQSKYRNAECYGNEAKEENGRLVEGKTIRLVSDVADTDKYGRLLRYVYVGNEFINEELVQEGFAVAEPIAPDTMFAAQFYQLQQEAKTKHIGLWAACP